MSLPCPQIPCLSPDHPSALTWQVLPGNTTFSVLCAASQPWLPKPHLSAFTWQGLPADGRKHAPRTGLERQGRKSLSGEQDGDSNSFWAGPPPAFWGQCQGPGHFLQLNRFFCDISLIMCKYVPNWAHFKLYLKCAGGEPCSLGGEDPWAGSPVLPFPGREETPFQMTPVKGCGSPCLIKPEDLTAPFVFSPSCPRGGLRSPRRNPAGDQAQMRRSRLLAGKRRNRARAS